MDPRSTTAPTVSVITPTYNRSKLLGRAIQSVLRQTYSDLELIVVDDGSTDDTPAVIGQIADPRVRYIRHQTNRGVSEARNSGVDAARGRLVGFVDADDEWLPTKLRDQIAVFDSSPIETGLVYGGCWYVSEETKRVIRLITPKKRGFVSRDLLARNFVLSPTPLVKKECFDRTGSFMPDLRMGEDWDMWFRISQHYRLEFVKEPVAKYYVSPYQTMNSIRTVIEGYRTFMTRHEHLIAVEPSILAHHLKVLGQLHVVAGEYAVANGYFAQAVQTDPRNLLLYVHRLAARTAPTAYAALGRWLKVNLFNVAEKTPS